MSELDRAIIDRENVGFIRVLTKKGTGHILGVTIVAKNACQLLPQWTQCMSAGLTMNHVLNAIHPYPSMGEVNRAVAAVWRHKNMPKLLFKLTHKWHDWNRS